MIARIRGNIVHKLDGFIIIETGGIGYKVRVLDHIISQTTLEQEIIVYTELIVRQDLLQLYGFSQLQEADMFRLLISVSHIGPQTGLAVLNKLSMDEIISAIITQKPDILSKVPGLGKKGAERIILELKNKISDFDTRRNKQPSDHQPMQDALLALKSLGYSNDEAEQALIIVSKGSSIDESSNIIKEALIHLRKK